MHLRGYQEHARIAFWHHIRTREDNPCVVIPTGGGKSPLMAALCRDAVDWGGRVLVLAHVKELLEQTAGKITTMAPGMSLGIYSAGLGRRDMTQQVIVGGIQSVYKKACDLGAFDIILVDEAHLIQPSEDGMYGQFFREARVVNPNIRIGGLTATPFRLKDGPICTPDGVLNHVCYEVGVKELVINGYLSPLVSKEGVVHANTDSIRVVAGEFSAGDMEDAFCLPELVNAACEEIVQRADADDRKGVLIFASGVAHGQMIVDRLKDHHGIRVEFVTGMTSGAIRDEIVKEFKSKQLRYLVNVNCFTTGFDAPHVDLVALLRSTLSTGLYYQMVGRGFRLAEGKKNCLVLDFGENVKRHGPVDNLRAKSKPGDGGGPAPVKVCPECQAHALIAVSVCPECGHVFITEKKLPHSKQADTTPVLSTGKVTEEWVEVYSVTYNAHRKKDAPDTHPRTMRVQYHYGPSGSYSCSEWICLEHPAGKFARQKAQEWWAARCNWPAPTNVDEAVQAADLGYLAQPLAVLLRSVDGEKYPTIIDVRLGEKHQEDPEDVSEQPHVEESDDAPFDINDVIEEVRAANRAVVSLLAKAAQKELAAKPVKQSSVFDDPFGPYIRPGASYQAPGFDDSDIPF